LELESAPATWPVPRLALTDTTLTIRTLARPTATMALTISSAEASSAPAPGSPAGDLHTMDGPTPADLQDLAALTDVASQGAVLQDMALRDMLLRLAMASQDTARLRHAEGPTVADSAANPALGSKAFEAT